jgi:anti-anti-sigma factor
VLGHGVSTRTVLDLAGNAGTLPGALLRTLVAHKVAFLIARELFVSIAMIPNPGSDTRRAQGTLTGSDSPRVAPTVLALHGDVEASTAQLLIDSMSAMIEWSGGDVVVDLTEVEFIDIASVRVLDEARQLLWREGRGLTFRSPSKLAATVLGLFGLTNLIEASEGAKR